VTAPTHDPPDPAEAVPYVPKYPNKTSFALVKVPVDPELGAVPDPAAIADLSKIQELPTVESLNSARTSSEPMPADDKVAVIV
jgi:hypothetical protein